MRLVNEDLVKLPVSSAGHGPIHPEAPAFAGHEGLGKKRRPQTFNNHSCSLALLNFHTRFGPAITLR